MTYLETKGSTLQRGLDDPLSMGNYQYKPDYAVPPGEILEEILEARNIKKRDLAERCGLSAKTVSLIISGKAPITPGTAIQFERVLGVPANIWNNLEANYRLFKESDGNSKHADK